MEFEASELSLEAKSLIQDSNDGEGIAVYVVLSDTGSWFQKIAKKVTKHPYNHVSLAFDDQFKEMYSYSIFTPKNGSQGGMMKESREEFAGSSYSLYSIKVDHEILSKMRAAVDRLMTNDKKTSYNISGLINAISGTEVFKDEDEDKMICSQFVSAIFEAGGISLLSKKGSLIKPYDLVKSKLLKFVRRGVIK